MFRVPEFKKVLKEEDMIRSIEGTKPQAKAPAPAGTWMQITFTLDSEHFRALWARAGQKGLTVPDLVRESVIDFLEEIKSAS